MIFLRHATLTVLLVFSVACGAHAQDVTLTSRDGDVEISGNLLSFDGEFYRVDTVYGELTVDGSGVLCEGPGCPNLDAYVAHVSFSGAPTIGRVLMPALIEAFAIREDYNLNREALGESHVIYTLSDKETGITLGEFEFNLTNSDEGFADLLANEADIVMSLREARADELSRARDAGIGNLNGRGRSQVIALDALVPVVSPSNQVQAITTPELARILAGEIDNWADLGGPNAPIALHLHDAQSGLGQATIDRVLVPSGLILAAGVRHHESSKSLIKAVVSDPFAFGVTSRSETGDSWVLALKGNCGFTLNATRRAVKAEDYPLTSPLFLYLPARRFPKLVREFLAYLRDPLAQLVTRRAGFVDLAPEEIVIDAQGNRFVNAITQAGDEIDLAELQRMTAALGPLKRLTTTFRFEAGSARLDAQSRSNVLQLARAMELGIYDARRLVFVGFSDGDGGAAANRDIAMRRAMAVRAAVTRAAEAANLSRINLGVEAFGEAMPMACDDSEWGRQINRRVEVWVR